MFSKQVLRITILLIALLLAVGPALGHEGRDVGDYTLTFGWRVEPAYAGVMNGPEIYITKAGGHHHGGTESHGDDADHDEEADHSEEADHHHDEPIDFAALNIQLQVEVTFGGQSITLPLRQRWGAPGHYIAELLPTLPGDYVFRVTGTIGDVEVDEIFDSADGSFSTVEPLADVSFPMIEDVQSRIAALEARIAALEEMIAAMEH